MTIFSVYGWQLELNSSTSNIKNQMPAKKKEVVDESAKAAGKGGRGKSMSTTPSFIFF